MNHRRPKEQLLHYLWRTKAFDHADLLTSAGEPLEIVKYGTYNQHDGPDFLNASIRIGEIYWSGAIEMHIYSSDWLKHGHTDQPAYGNVVLHVVLHHDREINKDIDEVIPCLELQSRVSDRLLHNYHELMHTRSWIPCADHITDIPSLSKTVMTERMLIERLQCKADEIIKLYTQQDNDLRKVAYQRIAWAFGLKANADAMMELAARTPLTIIDKHRDDLKQVEALLLGQSGLLDVADEDEYVDALRKEYSFLKRKFSLISMKAVQWKFMRIRPVGFPTIRIAQLARVLYQTRRLDLLLFEQNVDDILKALELRLNGYWETHYMLGEVSVKRVKSLGKDRRDLIIINAFAPLLFAYGIIKGSQEHKDKAMSILEQIRPEKNSIINHWKSYNYPAKSAADTQALLHLKKHYCDQYRCLECSIGHQLLKRQ